jgi:AraC-like DNA-binding protein
MSSKIAISALRRELFVMLALNQLLTDFAATADLQVCLLDITGQVLTPRVTLDSKLTLKVGHRMRTHPKTLLLAAPSGFALPVVLDEQLVGTILCTCPTPIPEAKRTSTITILQLLLATYINGLTQRQPLTAADDVPVALRSELKLAIQYIHSHLNENIALARISKQVFLSSYYFSKLFKKELGINYIDYVNGKKIRHAQLLLQDNSWSIDSIAQSLGFTQISYFSKTFKKVTGVSPRQFQKQCQAQQP